MKYGIYIKEDSGNLLIECLPENPGDEMKARLVRSCLESGRKVTIANIEFVTPMGEML